MVYKEISHVTLTRMRKLSQIPTRIVQIQRTFFPKSPLILGGLLASTVDRGVRSKKYSNVALQLV
jgi:hypothetical protein